ncbi:MAG: flavin reductase family protein [Ruminococcaceae bacterium]|nr:flavin reductase family protein [Oscillospiraceae bacterium]
MRKNFGAKPLLYPQPVFILAAYGSDGVPCAMNAAWGGISEQKEISMCISPEHRTMKNILETGAFTVSMATADYVAECDYVGVVSGNDVPDKLEKAGFHTVKSEYVNAPLIDELPMAVECKLVSYDPESCRLVGEIVNVSADERVLGKDKNVDPALLRPITFDPMNNTYVVLGDTIGAAFSDGFKIGG